MATSNKGRSELCFLVKTSMDEFNPEDRKLIRSHVMRGKNLGKARPLGSGKRLALAGTRRNTASLPSGFDVTSHDATNNSTSLSRISSNSPPYSEHRSGIQTLDSIPPVFGSAASTMYLADSVKPETVEVVLRRAENWIAPLAVDPAFLHATIFTCLYYYEMSLSRRPSCESQRVRHHYHKAVSLLRERLLCDDDDIRLSNNTISAVLSLAGQAFHSGDLKSAVNHIQGIRRMVDLRGGFSSITTNEKLIAEVSRCDIGVVVHSGSHPILFQDAVSSRAYRMYPKLDVFLDKCHLDRSSISHQFLTSLTLTHNIKIHGQLTAVWNAMSDFCSVINLAADSERRIDVRTFLRSMTSIMYNLLDMRFESSSWNETIRLGLLSFSCSVFLQWTRVGMSYPHLNSILRNSYAGLARSISSLPPKLVVWLLMAGAVTVFDESDNAWVHGLLLHDNLGKRVFDAAIGCSDAVTRPEIETARQWASVLIPA
ncbi:hypothetical protein CHU98_g6555 [Xylaria longipes]|nr:hypothetical protein CHU98_g6555 [Xylaria longipes]